MILAANMVVFFNGESSDDVQGPLGQVPLINGVFSNL
jgi:hypothetical protein